MTNNLGAPPIADPATVGGSDASSTFTTIAGIIGEAKAAGLDTSVLALAMIQAASNAAESAGQQRAAIALHDQQIDKLRATVEAAR